MAVWGKKLSSTILGAIDELNSTQDEEEPLEGVQRRLLLSAKDSLDRTCSLEPFGLLMDCPTVLQEIPEEQTGLEMSQDAAEVTKKIVEHVKNGSNNINVVIELVSNLSEERLNSVVDDGAKLLETDETRRSFIVALSATRNSAAAVSSRILLPAFHGEENFQAALDLYGPVLGWLESSVVEATVVPLLVDLDSSLNRSPGCCKALFEALTDSQRSETVAKFSRNIDDLQDWQLQTLSVILESFPVDNVAIVPLTDALVANIGKFPDDRLMGKIILSVIVSLSPATTPDLLSAVTNLVAGFKGSIRFRHKKALDKIAKQILPS